MLKRRNLKVLAAAIGVSVMSGLYASPVWAEDVVDIYPTEAGGQNNVHVGITNTNNGTDYTTSLTLGSASAVIKYGTNELVVGENGTSLTAGGQSLVVNSAGVQVSTLTVAGTIIDSTNAAALATVGNDITGLRTDVNWLGAKVENNANNINWVSDRVTTNAENINWVSDRVTTNAENINWVSDRVTTNAKNIDWMNGRLTTVETNTTDITYNATSDTTNIGNNVAISGGLTADTSTITKNATVGGDLGVTGGAAVGGALSVGAGAVFGSSSGTQTAIVGNQIYAFQEGENIIVEGVHFKDGTISYQNSYVINNDGTASFSNSKFVIGEEGAFSAANDKFGVDKDGNARINGSLNVKGAADFDANVNVDGKLDVGDGATFADKKVIIEDTGRTTFKSTQVEGETVINGGILRNETVMTQRVEVGDANGANTVTKDDGFYVKDKSDIVSKLNKDGLDVGKGNFTVDNNGNTKVGGTLDVTGATTLKSTLNVKDNADFDKNVNVDGRLDVADGASIKDGNGGILNVTGDGVGLHSDKNDTSTLSVTKNGVGMSSNQAISMNAAGATMSLSANGIGMHEGNSAATVTDAGIGLTTAKTFVTVTDNGATFIADKNVAEYTNINGDEITVTDGTNKTIVNSTDVSITDPLNDGNRINLSDLGQIDEVDDELAARMTADGVAPTAVNAIGTEAQIRREEVARLDNRIDRVEDRLDKVGAMTAAIANLRTMGYDPCAPSEFSMSLGHYRGETGMALGFFHYPNRDFMLSFSVSTAGDEYMGGIGATWKFGRKTPEQLAEEIKAKEAKKALAKAEAERKAAVAAKVRVQQAKHAEMQ